MKTRFLMFFAFALLLPISMAYAVPEPEYDTAFRHSEMVVIGKIISVDILSEPIIMKTKGSYSEVSGIAIYDVQVQESLKNPDGVERISVAGLFLREPHPMANETYPYQVGENVLLYLQENTHEITDTELIIRSGTSKTVDDYLHPNEFYYKFVGFQYANIVGEPIKFVLERIGHHDCYPYDVEITDEDGNFVTAFGAEPLCLPNKNPVFVSSKIKMEYHEDHQITIEESGKYFIKVNVDGISIEKEFVVRHNQSGITLDRTFYPISSEIPSPLKQMKLGIKLGHIICDKDKTPVWNTHYKPACVYPDSESELLKRGWAKLRLMLPAGPDPVKEMDWTGRNVMSMMLEGTFSYSSTPVETLDDKRNAIDEYSKQYHQGEQYLEYAIIPAQNHYDVGDKVQFELLEWGKSSACSNLQLRIIDVHDQSVFEHIPKNLCFGTDVPLVIYNSYSMGDYFDEFVCDIPGYYRIEVTNGDVFSPSILDNFACLETEPIPEPEPEPEPGPTSDSESLQRQKQQQTKLDVQKWVLTDTRDRINQINAIREYRDEFESGYFLEQFIHPIKQNYEKGKLMNFIYGEWGFQPTEITSPKVTVYFRSYENYDKIEKINEWQKPKDDASIAIYRDSDGFLLMGLHGMPPTTGLHEACVIPGEYRVSASNPYDESKVEWGYFTCQKDKLVGEPQPWMGLPE